MERGEAAGNSKEEEEGNEKEEGLKRSLLPDYYICCSFYAI